MKRTFILSLLTAITFMANSQTRISLTVGEKTMTATLVDNAATRELQALLDKGPITIQMNDYGGFEKVGALPQSFTTSNSQITTEPGDIMLYQGNNMVIFYGTNSWSYTRLGKIDGATSENLRQFLGSGNISLTVSLVSSAGVADITDGDKETERVFDLNGKPIDSMPLSKGIYIVNGKKTLIKH
ncbi:MAG: hypothetical protein K2K98_10735 [Muribaculaceae bacterium]|nr:hypothetical protein [Muribaculaceae bacterium]